MTTDGGDLQLRPLAADAPHIGLARPWRLIPDIDKDPQLVAFAQTALGRVAVFGFFAILLQLLGQNFAYTALAEACALAGSYRWRVIPVATLIVLCGKGFLLDPGFVAGIAAQEGVAAASIDIALLQTATLAGLFLLAAGAIKFWPRGSSAPLLRRPTLTLILCFLASVLIAQSLSAGVSRVVLWSFVITLAPYLWFLIYALSDVTTGARAPTAQYLGVMRPFWVNSPVPFGKSVAYLRKFEATNPHDLAVTQLKAVKLAIWAVMLAGFAYVFDLAIFDQLHVPKYDDAFAAFLTGAPYPWYVCWLSLVAFYFRDILTITIIGALFIGYARLAGFRLLRNTYKPLAATSIADFWNRYFFYFKELLVDHFFYPTFFTCFKKHPKLRVFFATFVAACIGNLFFHFAMDIHFVGEMGWQRALTGEASHAFYTLTLALGIAVSQMRKRPAARPARGFVRDRALPFVWVALFFCVLHVFDAPEDRVHTIGQHGQFLLHLLGLDTWI